MGRDSSESRYFRREIYLPRLRRRTRYLIRSSDRRNTTNYETKSITAERLKPLYVGSMTFRKLFREVKHVVERVQRVTLLKLEEIRADN